MAAIDGSVLIFTGAAQVATCTGPSGKRDRDPANALIGAAVAVQDGRIAAVGSEEQLLGRFPNAARMECDGGLITPGLIDSHTHSLFGPWRVEEFAQRSEGVTYMEIARRGGGINASVREVRRRSVEELVEFALPRLREMLHHGTTTAEIKSGYGLSTSDELKMLWAIERLSRLQPIRLIPTFLGAHEVPPEYRERREAYVELVVREMIPAVAEAGLARFCDVFMEPGVFTRAEAERVLRAGLNHGLVPKLHADEFEWSGGAELAAELGAASADHLGAVSDRGIEALAASSTVATLLPATLLFVGRGGYAPARRLLAAGAEVALATDFNPGSSPTSSLPLVMTLACTQMRMTPSEALRAATAGGAAALQLGDGLGTISVGAPADLVLWRVSSVAELPYRLAAPVCTGVWKGGERVM